MNVHSLGAAAESDVHSRELTQPLGLFWKSFDRRFGGCCERALILQWSVSHRKIPFISMKKKKKRVADTLR